MWRQLWLPSSPIGPAVTSTQASDQFKGYSADTCPPSAEVQLMAVQQIDRLTGASRHACWRCQFNTPDCPRPHDDGLRAICHALWLQDTPEESSSPSPARGGLCILTGQSSMLTGAVSRTSFNLLDRNECPSVRN